MGSVCNICLAFCPHLSASFRALLAAGSQWWWWWGAGAGAACGAVVAAKGVIRFPEISQDSTGEKAEEFLIGSISSWILAALVALFVRVALQAFG